jgi:hypothetical protein
MLPITALLGSNPISVMACYGTTAAVARRLRSTKLKKTVNLIDRAADNTSLFQSGDDLNRLTGTLLQERRPESHSNAKAHLRSLGLYAGLGDCLTPHFSFRIDELVELTRFKRNRVDAEVGQALADVV